MTNYYRCLNDTTGTLQPKTPEKKSIHPLTTIGDTDAFAKKLDGKLL